MRQVLVHSQYQALYQVTHPVYFQALYHITLQVYFQAMSHATLQLYIQSPSLLQKLYQDYSGLANT